jgi:hypothetical protein
MFQNEKINLILKAMIDANNQQRIGAILLQFLDVFHKFHILNILDQNDIFLQRPLRVLFIYFKWKSLQKTFLYKNQNRDNNYSTTAHRPA